MSAIDGGYSPPPPPKVSIIRPLIFLLILGAGIVAVQVFHLQEYLRGDRLQQFVASLGAWGPLVYLAVWTVLPLFCPGLPLTLAGGLLFGPFLGVIYVLVGATAGAILPFLVARYLARDWVESKIAGTRLMSLDAQVSRRGWMVVAVARLIPVFSYSLLNYAFGLTRIAIVPYALATFVFMLPTTVAYVYFSSNILQLLQGQVSREVIVGVGMVAVVILLPVAYKKLKKKRGESPDS